MNIRQAKEYIKDAISLYLKKDEFGAYKMSVVRQRPIFLLGAPGIGKTAVMEQIAQEMGIALVTYSMTHHTRQSALGLPFITEKSYGNRKVHVSEYTMSEIIATIYDTMEESGIREGILFLDEINCVSETLAPSMLQFLQYKVFGRHRVPDGWVIVTAGNPPEYNKSVREFDVVTMDRLKVMEVEPDYAVWKVYAGERRIHTAILNYLDLKKDHFYCMEMTVRGRSYVTARGWEDLSEMLYLYEEADLQVEEILVGQYIRNEKVAREFTAYYDLYQKYRKDYCIEDILRGAPSPQAIVRAKDAAFDERLSLLGMLLDRVKADMREVMEQAAYLKDLKILLQGTGKAVEAMTDKMHLEPLLELLEQQAAGRVKLLENLRSANTLSEEDGRKLRRVVRFLEETRKELYGGDTATAAQGYACLKEKYTGLVNRMKEETRQVQEELHALFVFAEEAFAQGNEMLVLVTELTVNNTSARFIAAFGSEDYGRHNQELMLSERRDEILAQMEGLEWE